FHFPDFNANDPDQVSASFILSSASVSVNGIIKLDLNPSESGQFVSQPIYLRSNPEFPDIQDGLDTEVRNSSALEPGNPAPLLVALSKGARQAALMIGDSECNLLPTVIPPFNGKDLGIYSL